MRASRSVLALVAVVAEMIAVVNSAPQLIAARQDGVAIGPVPGPSDDPYLKERQDGVAVGLVSASPTPDITQLAAVAESVAAHLFPPGALKERQDGVAIGPVPASSARV